jgi:hypothetical protein
MPKQTDSPSGSARWSLSPGWSIMAGTGVIALNAWSIWAADPDFDLPNPFAYLAIYLLVLFFLTGWVRSAFVRTNLRLGLGLFPVVLILTGEVWMKRRDERIAERLQRSSDLLLRYHYRPLAPSINSLGLWDREHEIPKPRDVYRIAVLGDSVPNDPRIPAESRFHRVMERNLSRDNPWGRKVEVVNVSCEGYNTIQEVRLLEKVGLRYEPDLVLVAYVLNDPFIQDGGYRRIGNSFFAFRFMPLIELAQSGSYCGIFTSMHRGYGFEFVVRSSFERLRLLAQLHGFQVTVVTLPLLEDFGDAACLHMYDQVGAVAREQGFGFVRVVDAFQGEDYRRYLKPTARSDITHPNEAGHLRIGEFLASRVRAQGAARQ